MLQRLRIWDHLDETIGCSGTPKYRLKRIEPFMPDNMRAIRDIQEEDDRCLLHLFSIEYWMKLCIDFNSLAWASKKKKKYLII